MGESTSPGNTHLEVVGGRWLTPPPHTHWRHEIAKI